MKISVAIHVNTIKILAKTSQHTALSYVRRLVTICTQTHVTQVPHVHIALLRTLMKNKER